MLITSFMGPFHDEALSCFPSSDHIFPCRPHYTLCPVLKSRLAPKSCPWLSALATLHLTCPPPWLQVNPVLKTPGSSRLGVPPFPASAPWATPIPCVQCCAPLTPGSSPFSIAILKSQHNHPSSLPSRGLEVLQGQSSKLKGLQVTSPG